jgi:hypothetical protein
MIQGYGDDTGIWRWYRDTGWKGVMEGTVRKKGSAARRKVRDEELQGGSGEWRLGRGSWDHSISGCKNYSLWSATNHTAILPAAFFTLIWWQSVLPAAIFAWIWTHSFSRPPFYFDLNTAVLSTVIFTFVWTEVFCQPSSSLLWSQNNHSVISHIYFDLNRVILLATNFFNLSWMLPFCQARSLLSSEHGLSANYHILWSEHSNSLSRHIYFDLNTDILLAAVFIMIWTDIVIPPAADFSTLTWKQIVCQQSSVWTQLFCKPLHSLLWAEYSNSASCHIYFELIDWLIENIFYFIFCTL